MIYEDLYAQLSSEPRKERKDGMITIPSVEVKYMEKAEHNIRNTMDWIKWTPLGKITQFRLTD